MKQIYKKIASAKEFESEKDYNRYMLAVKYAQKINSLRDKGYFILDDNQDLIKREFIFNFMGATVGTYQHFPKNDGIKHSCWSCISVGCSEKGYYVIDTLNSIKKTFSKYKVINPKNIKTLNV